MRSSRPICLLNIKTSYLAPLRVPRISAAGSSAPPPPPGDHDPKKGTGNQVVKVKIPKSGDGNDHQQPKLSTSLESNLKELLMRDVNEEKLVTDMDCERLRQEYLTPCTCTGRG
jgi:hypothetical protein